MKLLMVNVTSTVEDYLIPKLILKGVEVYSAEDDLKAIELMDRIHIDTALIDIDHKNIDFFSFLQTVRKKDEYENLRSIVISNNIDKKLFAKYLAEGLIGVLTKGANLESFDSKIIKWIDSKVVTEERRKNVRIIPKDEDRMKIRLPITGRTSDRSEGKILDLSIQGVAFEFSEHGDDNYFLLNQEVGQVEIDIRGRRLLTTMKLVRLGEVSVGIYVKPKESFIIAIAKNIFEVLQDRVGG